MYKATDRMCDLIASQHESLQIISRFGLPLGVGDKTIDEICEQYNVHTTTFLIVVNYKLHGAQPTALDELSLHDLMNYLRNAHSNFFDFSLPNLRRKLIEAINHTQTDGKIPLLIMRYFDEYVHELNTHMQHENQQLFPYVEALLKHEPLPPYSIEQFAHQHRAVDDQHIALKLTELKNLIIKYYPTTADNFLLFDALHELFDTEHDLAIHCDIEDNILLPAVRALEKKSPKHTPHLANSKDEQDNTLSDREKDVLIEVVNGLSNKEIADKLCISIHTVISHRKNITRKLDIHSSAGLTIYAIVNNLVDINSFQ